ncbi:MAG: hypothetical protein HY917_00230 [Candidatus Diapherotrites archaeon]|nr:hypothetical protein [Candidatus Diapherotrites archaeon]
MGHIISSFPSFEKEFKDNSFLAANPKRTEALRAYFAQGGVVSLSRRPQGWPKLVYPSQDRILSQKAEVTEVRKTLMIKKRSWEKKREQALNYHKNNHLKKFAEPLYWKHQLRIAVDKDYRDDTDRVKLPTHLVADPRWKPLIKTFLENMEYRKQLTETIQTSIAYKGDKHLAQYADDIISFREDISGKELKELDRKIDSLDRILSALNQMELWAKD